MHQKISPSFLPPRQNVLFLTFPFIMSPYTHLYCPHSLQLVLYLFKENLCIFYSIQFAPLPSSIHSVPLQLWLTLTKNQIYFLLSEMQAKARVFCGREPKPETNDHCRTFGTWNKRVFNTFYALLSYPRDFDAVSLCVCILGKVKATKKEGLWNIHDDTLHFSHRFDFAQVLLLPFACPLETVKTYKEENNI